MHGNLDNTPPLPWATPQDSAVADLWGRDADRLTHWAQQSLIVRTDAYGRYRAPEELASNPTLAPVTIEKRYLPPQIIRSHFCATRREHVIGALTTDLDDLCRATQWDIDLHDDGDPIANTRYALLLYQRLVDMGHRPLLTDSNGRGGYHLRVLYKDRCPARGARSLGLWLIRDWAEYLPKSPEVFPKQNVLTGIRLGNWLRLPGKHHSRDHWSRCWNGQAWEDGPRMLFQQVGNHFTLPDEALSYSGADNPKTRDSRTLPPGAITEPSPEITDLPLTVALARDALRHYPNSDADYDTWFKIGCSLSRLGMDGFILWLDWSAQSEKFDEDNCYRCWASIDPAGGCGLGTLYYLAGQAGWDRAARAKAIGRRVRQAAHRAKVKEAMAKSRPQKGDT
jgi:hypothetical protein